MILLGEKEHLSDVSSWLKPFYDHLRGHRDNLKKLDFSFSMLALLSLSHTIAFTCILRIPKIKYFQIISMTAQVVVKRFYPRTKITKMFLFHQLYYGQRISDFEKIDIFGVTPEIWPCVQGL